MKIKYKRKIKSILVISLILILCFSAIYSYWFYTRDIEVNFQFYWEYPIIENQDKLHILLVIDNIAEYNALILKQDENNNTPYKEFKTYLKYGEHKFTIYYSDRTITISKNIVISDKIYVITHQKSPTELYIEIMKNAPN
jgi:hypothetical protein